MQQVKLKTNKKWNPNEELIYNFENGLPVEQELINHIKWDKYAYSFKYRGKLTDAFVKEYVDIFSLNALNLYYIILESKFNEATLDLIINSLPNNSFYNSCGCKNYYCQRFIRNMIRGQKLSESFVERHYDFLFSKTNITKQYLFGRQVFSPQFREKISQMPIT